MTFVLEEVIATLARTPSAVSTLTQVLPDAWLHADEGPGTWSPFDIVGHLVHGERVDWMARARILREHGEAQAFEPFEREGHRAVTEGRRLGELLDELASARAEHVSVLRGWALTEDDLDRRGRHPDPAFAPVTLRQLLATWVVHDLGHIAQIARVACRHVGDDVGPWKAYLPVLHPR